MTASSAPPSAPPSRALKVYDPKPPWLKVRAPGGENYTKLKQTLRELDLYTVCEEARCPNVAECWAAGTATVMLLGHTCTRGCRFCAVTTGNPRGAVDPREPEHVARAISQLGLRYVVLTMVDRDDLLDGGASHMARAVVALREHSPGLLVETLVGDFGGRMRDVNSMVDSGPDVFAHNIEVTRRLTPRIRDQRCDYDLSLRVLAHAKARYPERFVKSSIMVGVGETDDEVLDTMRDLRAAGVDIVTLGQYLRPTPKHAAVERYVTPERFDEYARAGREMGFAFVASGPLVRSSYHAAEGFVEARLRPPLTSEGSESRVAANGNTPPQAVILPLTDGPQPALIRPESLVRR
ncbi:MAG: lipoyl synthase [Myxococcales bacterium]